MIGKIIGATFLIVLFAGLGLSGIVSAEITGYNNLSSNKIINGIEHNVENATYTILTKQMQGIENSTLNQELGS